MLEDKVNTTRSGKTLAASIGKSLGFVGKGGMILGVVFGFFNLLNGFDVLFLMVCVAALVLGLTARSLSRKILATLVHESPSGRAVAQVGERRNEMFTMRKLGVILVFTHLLVLMIVGLVAGLT